MTVKYLHFHKTMPSLSRKSSTLQYMLQQVGNKCRTATLLCWYEVKYPSVLVSTHFA